MSNVSKPGATPVPPPGEARRDVGEPDPKGGDFEAVLLDKGRDARVERGESATAGPRTAGAEGGSARGASTRADDTPAERGHGEAGQWRALPGDVAVPARLDPGALAAVERSHAADAVARIERIAEQIVRAVEVRVGPAGSAEVLMELDLGRLGRLGVALGRDAEGMVAVRFDGAGPEAARLLVNQGKELVARLEGRGLVLREVVLSSADGSIVRLGSAAEPAPDDLASRLPNATRARGEASRHQLEDERRRGRGEPPPVEDEE